MMNRSFFLKIGCAITTIMFVVTVSHTIVSAQTESSPSATATDEASIQENLKERVKKAAEEQRKIKGTATNGVKKGFTGTVKRISEESITFDSTRGVLIIPTQGVAFVSNNKAIATKDIEIGNEVIIMGYQNGDDFQARRVVVYKTTIQPPAKSIFIGNVGKVDKQSVTITTRGSAETKTFSIDTKTTTAQNLTGESIKIATIEAGQDVILIVTPEDPAFKSVNNSSGKIVVIRSLAESKPATP